MVGADLSANAVFQPLHMRRMYRPFRGQTERRPVRSHKIEFLQWVTGCLIRGGLPAICREPAARPAHTVCQM
ncbi:hypothetical protein EZZ81_08405 [Pseudomonas viridiflava]|uniref:Uncharacterized protein n=1 Tax=Pseudomonas viridiflava TaxID=33069 RepID=A0AA46VW89_PSEVI|nr:hypothetical protein EZZ81_08405 [Pseudomonas viridiflava]